MPTIVAHVSYSYLEPASPVGFEAMLTVYDTTAGGGAMKDFISVISIDPSYASCWTDQAASSTGLKDNAGNYIRHPADSYDPEGITATWQGRISDNPASPTRFVLRGRFDASTGLIVVQVESVQIDDPANSASNGSNPTVISIPIPAPSPL